MSPVILYFYDPTGDDGRGCSDERGFYRSVESAQKKVDEYNAMMLVRKQRELLLSWTKAMEGWSKAAYEHNTLVEAGVREGPYVEPPTFKWVTDITERGKWKALYPHYHIEPMEFEDDS